MFMQTLRKIFKRDWALPTMKFIDHYQQVEIKNVIGLMKYKLGGNIMKETVLY